MTKCLVKGCKNDASIPTINKIVIDYTVYQFIGDLCELHAGNLKSILDYEIKANNAGKEYRDIIFYSDSSRERIEDARNR